MKTRFTVAFVSIASAVSTLLPAAPALAFQPKGAQSATAMWDARCASCHGASGAGVSGKAKSLLGDALMEQSLDRRFFETLTTPKAPHAGAVTAGLDDKACWALIVHLRELQHNEWRQRQMTGPAEFRKGAAQQGHVYKGQRASYRIETVYDKDLKVPWAIEWLPVVPPASGPRSGQPALPTPARVLVTEREGVLNIYEGGTRLGEVQGLPKMIARGQGGLMDVAAHPEYASNGWVYIAFAEPSEDGKREMTKVVRGRITESPAGSGEPRTFNFTDQKVIFQPRADNYNGPGVHYGSRIVFEKPGTGVTDAKGRYYVHFAIGERGGMEQAQQLDRPNGKNHRVWDDGSIPSDNPYANSTDKGVYPSIWSKGHRNQQGVCFDDEGNLWVTEHAPRGGDELNLIAKGANYGWPQACFGINYSDYPFVTPWKEKATDGTPITMPVFRWIKSIAACGLDCARAANVKTTFPEWSGDLFAGGLAGQNVDRLRVKDGKLVEREEILHGAGRVRDVAFGPDGYLYLVLNDPDKVVRLVPAK